jgi:hypothetical protein
LNNLKQFGVAFHSYHTTHNQFAPGWLEDNNPNRPDRLPNLLWGAVLLEYLEEQLRMKRKQGPLQSPATVTLRHRSRGWRFRITSAAAPRVWCVITVRCRTGPMTEA